MSDKFYTNPDISKKYIEVVCALYPSPNWDAVIEPSAGNGSFLDQLPYNKKITIGIDIEPDTERPDILKQDFLLYRPEYWEKNKRRVLVIGNPPFGRGSSMAVKFFNKAAEYATVIAFIVPRTFRRISVQNRLCDRFRLLHDEDVPMSPCSFTPAMMAKCCFQVWEKTADQEPQRAKIRLSVRHRDWEFVAMGPKDEKGQPTPPPASSGVSFAVRAYGGKCGEIARANLETLRPKSWHWIRCEEDPAALISRFESLDFSVSTDTARQNSIGRGELVRLYSESYG
jgi:hypothetical protein